MDLKITRIRWNPGVKTSYYNGIPNGQNQSFDEVDVASHRSMVQSITELMPNNQYEINFKNGNVLRVFNPIDVLFTPVK